MYSMSGSGSLFCDSLGSVIFWCQLQPQATIELATAAIAFPSEGFLFWCLCLKNKKLFSGDCLVSELDPLIKAKSLVREMELS